MKKMILNWYQEFKNYCLKDDRTFAKGFCFSKLVLIFVLGCMIGVYYEQILTLFNHYMADGSVVWESRRGVIYGPFNPLYGAGIVVMTIILTRKEHPWYITLLYGSLAGGIFEYVASFLQEWAIGTTSWDYTGYFLNIGGRTTIPFMLAWGIGGIIFAYVVYPFVSNLIEKIPYNLGMLLTKALVIFMTLNMLISWTALLRQTLRRHDYPAYTPVGKLYDKIYPDEYLARYFPNMRPKRVGE